ncbi:MAG TPA: hypothetical protein VKV02_00960 [Acidobacteriaceae bacterium]|nr:hypothetical protein [Acidobacteriaceae bacterium]
MGWWPVWRAYRRRLRLTGRVGDDERRAVEAHRVKIAYRVLRSRERREQVLVDLAVQPGWWQSLTHADVAVRRRRCCRRCGTARPGWSWRWTGGRWSGTGRRCGWSGPKLG